MTPLALLLSTLLLCPGARAEDPEVSGLEDVETSTATWDARISFLQGHVAVFVGDDEDGLPAEADMPLQAGDRIETGRNGRAEVAFEADSLLELGPNSVFVVDAAEEEDTWLDLAWGSFVAKLKSLSSRGRSMRVRTPTAVAAVRGTELAVEVSEDGTTEVGVFDEGKVAVMPLSDDSQEVLAMPRQQVTVSPSGDDVPSMRVSRLDKKLGRHEARLKRIRGRRAKLRKTWTKLSDKRAERRESIREKHAKKLKRLSKKRRAALQKKLRRKALPGKIVQQRAKRLDVRQHRRERRRGVREKGREKIRKIRNKRRGIRGDRRGKQRGRRGTRRGQDSRKSRAGEKRRGKRLREQRRRQRQRKERRNRGKTKRRKK